jgi:hypothetical protein
MGFIQHPLTFYTVHGWSVYNHKWVCDSARQTIEALSIIYADGRNYAREHDGHCNTMLALLPDELITLVFDFIARTYCDA